MALNKFDNPLFKSLKEEWGVAISERTSLAKYIPHLLAIVLDIQEAKLCTLSSFWTAIDLWTDINNFKFLAVTYEGIKTPTIFFFLHIKVLFLMDPFLDSKHYSTLFLSIAEHLHFLSILSFNKGVTNILVRIQKSFMLVTFLMKGRMLHSLEVY